MIRRPPRSTLFPTRRSSDLERPDLLECERVVCQHPALITVIAPVRTEAGLDGAMREQQTGAVYLVQVLECRHRAGVRFERGFQHHGAIEFLLSRCHIERVQAMYKGSVLLCLGYYVQSARIGIDGIEIDDRSGHNAEFRESSHAGALLHRPWYCGDSSRWIDKTNLPKWLRVDARVVVCIKRIHAVMLRRHIDHVMHSAARYRNIRQVQGLPHHDAVDILRKQFSKI